MRSTPIVRAECFQLAGPFDERLRASAEDYEMWARILMRTRLRLRSVPEVLTGYRLRIDSVSFQCERFLSGCRLAVDLLRAERPDLPEIVWREAMAGHLRVASRKALDAGRRGLALRLLRRAVREDPRLMLREPRALGGLFLVLTGGRFGRQLDAFNAWLEGVDTSRRGRGG